MPWTASPPGPIRKTGATPRSARSCCAATRASDGSYRACSIRSRSKPVLEALGSLRALEGRPRRVSVTMVSLKIVNGRWRRLVLSNPQLGEDEVDRRGYSFCVLEALQGALRRRDVFVPRAGRFTDPRAKLLDGPAWTAARPEICVGLNLDPAPQRALEKLAAQLDSAYRQTADRLDANLALENHRERALTPCAFAGEEAGRGVDRTHSRVPTVRHTAR
jgi:hypothetical protein